MVVKEGAFALDLDLNKKAKEAKAPTLSDEEQGAARRAIEGAPMMQRLLSGGLLRERTSAANFVLALRNDGSISNSPAWKFYRDGKPAIEIELLASGRQFAAYAIHPSGEPYLWADGRSPETVALSELPLVSADDLRRLHDEIAEALSPLGLIEAQNGLAAGGDKAPRSTNLLETLGAPPAYLRDATTLPSVQTGAISPRTPPVETMRAILLHLNARDCFTERKGVEKGGDGRIVKVGWIDCGMALKLAYGDKAGCDLWSLIHGDDNARANAPAQWESFASEQRPGHVAVATLVKAAIDAGFVFPSDDTQMNTCVSFVSDHSAPVFASHGPAPQVEWPEPMALPEGLSPVATFDIAFLPESIGHWVADIAERMQCPQDFVGVPAIISLGAVIGRRVAIRPQRENDWCEVPNLWGCIVGRPGTLKSPAMQEALKLIHRLDAMANQEHEAAMRAYASAVESYKNLKDAAKNRPHDAGPLLKPQEPKARRYVVNDTSYEALGEILADNPNGVLAFRDELVSLLKTLDREEHAAARGFFLTAWNGTSGYTFDRIMRGKTRIDAACLSLLGGTQPGRLAEYMRRAMSGGAGDDGLIQRFGLLVWPDQSPEWREVDRYANTEHRTSAWEAICRLRDLTADKIKAEADTFESLPFLRFDDRASGLFKDWRADLEKRLRSADMSPALESHLAKYRKLVPALALINHLSDGGIGPISQSAVSRALHFSKYLETHARRAYGAGIEAETAAAKVILARIRKGDLREGFTARDIRRKEWSGLAGADQVKAGLDLLADFGWIAPRIIQSMGRPSTTYSINPRGMA
ncbi:YfjI family protein [Methylocystis sp. B8]|uniref:YfjI family protein n=1 Tax=Methylocystis sp. B8 TaxID=544938 RepID=UPI0032B1F2B0